MSLSDELRLARLRRLHAKFLDASDKHPTLNHVVCRSDQERLWTIISTIWHSSDAIGAKTHEEFWRKAIEFGRYSRLCPELIYVSHIVRMGGKTWIGRYGDSDWDVCEALRQGIGDLSWLNLFTELSQEAADNFVDRGKPPAWICDPDEWSPDVEEFGHNLWLNTVYTVFAHEPERWSFDPDFPFPMEPGETFFVTGLPCNVFLASARAIEILIAEDNGLSDRTADGETDSQKSNVGRLPDNPNVLKLAKKMRSERESGATMKDIAMDFTDGDEAKAESLLRQLRRYRSLLR